MIIPNLKLFFIDDDSYHEFAERGIPIESNETCSYCGLNADLDKLKRNFEINLVHEHRKDGQVYHKFYDFGKCTPEDYAMFGQDNIEDGILKDNLCPKISQDDDRLSVMGYYQNEKERKSFSI